MLEDQVIPIDFGQGLDTKTDPKQVVGTKFQILQNGIFTNTKRITKRNGYDAMTMAEVGGTVISNPLMVKAYRNELICSATGKNGPNRLFSYSKSLSGWEDVGEYASIKVEKQIINGAQLANFSNLNISSTANCSCVVSGNYALYVFDSAGTAYGKNAANSGTAFTYITIVDLQTGQHLVDSQEIFNTVGGGQPALGFSKAAVLGASTFAVFYMSSAFVGSLAVRTITISGSGISGGPEVIIGTCAATSSSSAQFPYCYDFVTTPTGAIVAVANQPNINLYKINTAGATTATATISSSGNITPISVSLDASNNAWIYWVSAGTTLRYAIYSSALASVLAATTINSSVSNAQQIAAINTDSTHQVVYYSQYTKPSGDITQAFVANILHGQVSLTGTVVDLATFLGNLDIYGKPFTVSGRSYLPCMAISQSLATGFIVDLTLTGQNTGVAVAKFLQTEAEGIYQAGYGLTGASSPVAPAIIGTRYPGFINSVQTQPDGTMLLAAGFVINLTETVNTSSTNLSTWPTLVTTAVSLGVSGITFDFNNIDSNQALVQQDTLVLNGGVMGMYDGAYTAELGYNIDADNMGAVASTTGGAIHAATYIYFFTYEWIDANGNLYESAPSPGVTVLFTTGTTNKVLLDIPFLVLTQKKNVIVKIWRSDSINGGGIAYQIGIFNTLDPSIYFNQFTDTLAATAVVNNPTLYTEAGSILENISPPPAMILWSNNGRLWVVDSENPESNIEYSKTESSGVGISFSTGQLEVVIDTKGGEITGASPMDEKTVIIKEFGIGYFIGDGANDAGTGSTITTFQFIPTDTGGTNSKSVILFPEGILFRTTKGVYVLTRSVQTAYFGMAVEAFNSQDIRAAEIVPNKNQIRFLTSSGSSLLFDYVMNQWSVFTNHSGVSSTNWQGNYIYVRSDGAIYAENTTSFLDNTTSYALVLETAWMTLSSIQNFERIRSMLTLGDYQNGSSALHGIQIQAAYDFVPTYGTAIPYYFDGDSGSGPFQYRNFFMQQKCNSLSLLITEITNNVSGEYLDLTNMEFLAGIKKGYNKVTAKQSVG